MLFLFTFIKIQQEPKAANSPDCFQIGNAGKMDIVWSYLGCRPLHEWLIRQHYPPYPPKGAFSETNDPNRNSANHEIATFFPGTLLDRSGALTGCLSGTVGLARSQRPKPRSTDRSAREHFDTIKGRADRPSK